MSANEEAKLTANSAPGKLYNVAQLEGMQNPFHALRGVPKTMR
jgi:hypothetical protein